MKLQMGAGSILDFGPNIDIDTGQRISDDIILIVSSQLSLKFTLISTSLSPKLNLLYASKMERSSIAGRSA